MIHLKYKLNLTCEITFNLNRSLPKAGFRKCHRRPQHRLPLGCEPRELGVEYEVVAESCSIHWPDEYPPTPPSPHLS
jgi:hypothetical protein